MGQSRQASHGEPHLVVDTENLGYLRTAWLRVDRLLGELGIPRDSAAGRQQLERVMEKRRRLADPRSYAGIRRGWCWGEEAFKKELLSRVEERSGASHGEELRRETNDDK